MAATTTADPFLRKPYSDPHDADDNNDSGSVKEAVQRSARCRRRRQQIRQGNRTTTRTLTTTTTTGNTLRKPYNGANDDNREPITETVQWRQQYDDDDRHAHRRRRQSEAHARRQPSHCTRAEAEWCTVLALSFQYFCKFSHVKI